MTFLLGSAAGAVLCYMLLNETTAAESSRSSRSRSRDSTEELARALDLDGDQKEQLRGIIKESRSSYRSLSRQFRPQYNVIRQETNEAIRRILHPDQQILYDEMLQEIRSRHKSRSHK
jgi:hypothetical protein